MKIERNKQVAHYYPLEFEKAAPVLKGVNMFAHKYPINPFLVVTEYYMSDQVFGPHPHAGISVLTYILPKSIQGFTNRDSLGNKDTIEPGGYHITQAGSGMHHDEFPETPGKDVHGFQIWINHSEENRMVTPKAMNAKAKDVPKIRNSHSTVRIVQGIFKNQSANHKMVTPVTLLDIEINPFGSIILDSDEMTFIYVIDGNGTLGSQKIDSQSLSIMDYRKGIVEVEAQENGIHFLFASAQPIDEAIVYGGPFVMTTEEQMSDIKKRYGRGELGQLKPYKY